MNLKIIKIAFRNVLKHKKRTFFNAFTFAANAFALIALIGMLNGMYNSAYERTIALETGHFKIYNKGYLEEEKKMPLDKNIKNAGRVAEDIKNIPYFRGAAPRIRKNATLSDTEKKTGIILNGIDMKAELKAMDLFDTLDRENYLEKGKGQVLVGKKLAELMGIEKNDPLLIYGQTRYKSNNLSDVIMKGYYNIGYAKMEKNVAFVPLKFAQRFFDMDGSVTEIVVSIDSREHMAEAEEGLKNALSKHPSLTYRTWKEEAAALVAGAKADYMSYMVLFAILLFLAVFIIMNTLTITVFERTPEIGTLRAIGMKKSQIGWAFMFEGIILSLIGAVIGGILAIPMAYYMNVYGIAMPAEYLDMVPFPIQAMKSKNVPMDWLLVTGICLVTGIIGAVLPCARAAKTNITKALMRGVR